MKRTRKIKRYNRIYRTGKHRVRPLQVVLITIGCLALFFVGFSVIGPISDYLSGKIDPASSSSTLVSVLSSSSQEESSSEESSGSGAVAVTATHSAYLPASAVRSTSSIDTLISQLQALDINNVVLELKDEDGVIYYDSKVETAVNAGVISSNPIDLPAVIERFTASGITVTAKLHAFQDDPGAKYLGALTGSSDAVVRYKGDTSYVWLDRAEYDGGKRWLNPYSDAAQKYITDLSEELVSLGCTGVMLDSVQFPSGQALNMTDYGSKANTMTKQEALKGFITSLQQDLGEQDAKLLVQVPAMAAIEEQADQYGGSVLALGAQNLALTILPSELGRSITVGGQSISAPGQNPGEAVRAILAQIQTILGTTSSTQLTAVIEGGSYSKEQVGAQITAAASAGLESYLLYSEDGDYRF